MHAPTLSADLHFFGSEHLDISKVETTRFTQVPRLRAAQSCELSTDSTLEKTRWQWGSKISSIYGHRQARPGSHFEVFRVHPADLCHLCTVVWSRSLCLKNPMIWAASGCGDTGLHTVPCFWAGNKPPLTLEFHWGCFEITLIGSIFKFYCILKLSFIHDIATFSWFRVNCSCCHEWNSWTRENFSCDYEFCSCL